MLRNLRLVKWFREWFREWLGIKDPAAFMGVDLGYRDYTAVIVLQRTASKRGDILEILNFPARTPIHEIRKACRELGRKYGVQPSNFVQDIPQDMERFKL